MSAPEERPVDRTFDVFRAAFQAALSASIPDHIGRLNWDRARIEAMQRDRLRALLTIAIERSPSTPAAWRASTRQRSNWAIFLGCR